VCAAVPLAVLVHLGTHVRYMADDYCSASYRMARGFWGAQVYWYEDWTGSVAFNFLITVFSYPPPLFTRAWPALVIACWIGALTWAVAPFASIEQRALRRLVLLWLAAVVVVTTLGRFADSSQTLFWLNGGLRYLPPLVLFTLYGGLCARALRPGPAERSPWPGRALAAILAFLAGSFTETFFPLEITCLALALAATLLWGSTPLRQRLAPWLVAGWIGAVAAAVVTVLAPATTERQSHFPDPPDAVTLVRLTGSFTWVYLDSLVRREPLPLAAALGAGWIVGAFALVRGAAEGSRLPAAVRVGWWLVPATAVVAIASSFAPGAWALSKFPPFRMLVVPRFALIVGLVAWGALLGSAARAVSSSVAWGRAARGVGGLLAAAIAVLEVAYPLWTSWELGRMGAPLRAQALAWDNFDRLVRERRERGEKAIVLPSPDNFSQLETLTLDATNWVNVCASDYYGVSITGHPPPRFPKPRTASVLRDADAEIGGVARLIGFVLEADATAAARQLRLKVRWLPLAHTTRPREVFVRLLDSARRPLAAVEAQPRDGRYGTTVWVPGRPFDETYVLTIPAAELPVAGAELVLGLQDEQSGERLPVHGRDAGPPEDRWVRIGGVRLE
jgi:hypothetical protein